MSLALEAGYRSIDTAQVRETSSAAAPAPHGGGGRNIDHDGNWALEWIQRRFPWILVPCLGIEQGRSRGSCGCREQPPVDIRRRKPVWTPKAVLSCKHGNNSPGLVCAKGYVERSGADPDALPR